MIIGNNILNESFLSDLSRYRSLSAYNQSLIAHIMARIIFLKYLPPVRSQLFPKLKMLRIY